MKILSIQALRGPNFWSNSFPKLIQARIELDLIKTNQYINWKEVQSFLENYFYKGDISKIKSSEELVLFYFANIALALQNSCGNSFSFFEFKSTSYSNIFNVVFEYSIENMGIEAAYSSEKIINNLFNNNPINFKDELEKIQTTFKIGSYSTELKKLIAAAKEKGIPIIEASDENPMQFGYGVNRIEISNENSGKTIDEFFLDNKSSRIPIIAVTGSNGKTTTTRLIAHLLGADNKMVGFTTSDGVYLNNRILDLGDTTGPLSAELVLRNKEVEIAVLETARGGIVRAGLGFDQCDIAVVTNVQDDHLGISDIETMQDLARVKNVVVEAVKNNGFVVLNAENEFTIEMGKKAKRKVAWFSKSKQNVIIDDGLITGGIVAYIEEDIIVIETKNNKVFVTNIKDVPITFNGKLSFMVENVLAASLTGFLFSLETEVISNRLKTFFPSAEQTPGRMNIFEVGKCKFLLDFAHNPDGFRGIRDYLKGVESPNKIGIIVGTGDRKREDVIELGRLSAQMFNHILIHQAKFLRGKTAKELVDLLVIGIESIQPKVTWEWVNDEIEPLGYALSIAREGSLIVALSDVLENPMSLLVEYKAVESSKI